MQPRADAYSIIPYRKRGINGTFHHVSRQHLDRYIGEFQFRFNNRKVEDSVRAVLAVKGAEGKRLVYKEINS